MRSIHRAVFAAATLVSGAAFAATASYTVDPAHTYPSFEVPHAGISWFRGKFNSNEGKITLDVEAKTGTVDILIDANSIDFGLDRMNEEAKKAGFFNTGKYPQITYKGPIVFAGDMPAQVDGQLTLLGVSKPVKLKINSFKCMTHPVLKKEVCGADAEAEFNRADFGMTYGAEGAAGAVKLRIQVEAHKDG